MQIRQETKQIKLRNPGNAKVGRILSTVVKASNGNLVGALQRGVVKWGDGGGFVGNVCINIVNTKLR